MEESESESQNPRLRALSAWWRKIVGRQSRADLIAQIIEMRAQGRLTEDAGRMIEGVLHIADMKVRDVMIPNPEVVSIPLAASRDEAVATVTKHGHSRYPVYDRDRKKIVGILLAKDLLAPPTTGENFDLQKIMREPLFEPCAKPLNVMLEDFRRRRFHIAVAIDEYGLPAGLVSIEDALERIVGDIEDEFDPVGGGDISALRDGVWRVKGTTPLAAFNRHFHSRLEAAGADTIAGWILRRRGEVPRQGEAFADSGFHFEVSEADSRRILSLQISRRARAEKPRG